MFIAGKDNKNCFLGTAGFIGMEHLYYPIEESSIYNDHYVVSGSPSVSRQCSSACQGKKATYMAIVST